MKTKTVALLDRATNYFGPLRPGVKKAIIQFLDKPSAKAWDRIASIVIRYGRNPSTVWQAVIATDPTFPRATNSVPPGERPDPARQWPRVPDAVLVARAIKMVLDTPPKEVAK